jgi:hypothetical protein
VSVCGQHLTSRELATCPWHCGHQGELSGPLTRQPGLISAGHVCPLANSEPRESCHSAAARRLHVMTSLKQKRKQLSLHTCPWSMDLHHNEGPPRLTLQETPGLQRCGSGRPHQPHFNQHRILFFTNFQAFCHSAQACRITGGAEPTALAGPRPTLTQTGAQRGGS